MIFCFNTKASECRIENKHEIDSFLQDFVNCLRKFHRDYSTVNNVCIINFNKFEFNQEIADGILFSQWLNSINNSKDVQLLIKIIKANYSKSQDINDIFDFAIVQGKPLISLPMDNFRQCELNLAAGKISNIFNVNSFEYHEENTFPKYEVHRKHINPTDLCISPILTNDEESYHLLKGAIKYKLRRYNYDYINNSFIVFTNTRKNIWHAYHTNKGIPKEIKKQFQK